MDGIHDMGGMDGFGPIPIEQDEPVFHAPWEGRMWALNMALGALGKWNIDAGRYTMEQLDPALYLSSSYYLRWLYRTENILVDRGLVSREELSGAAKPENARGEAVAVSFEDIAGKSRSARVDEEVPARFAPGDAIRARNMHPTGHTRIPRYVRCKAGVIDRDHGVFIFPDSNAVFAGKAPQHLYSVRFDAREIWGPDASAKDKIYVDMWDDYLEVC